LDPAVLSKRTTCPAIQNLSLRMTKTSLERMKVRRIWRKKEGIEVRILRKVLGRCGRTVERSIIHDDKCMIIVAR
jgi:hypothetical protein